ncbi:MAG: single-stranded DNA-binding protein [Pirellulales bacterium]
MANFNRVILVGNVTRDIDLKYTPTNLAVTDIGMAVNDKRKNASGEWVEETTFVDVTLWGRTAEVASEYLSKGASVLIEGRLKLDQWDDKQSGQKRSKLRVIGERMQMLGGKGGGGGGPARGGRSNSASSYDESEYGGSSDSYEAPAARGAGSSMGGSPPQDDIPF